MRASVLRMSLLLLVPLTIFALLLPVLGGLSGGHALAYINLYTSYRDIFRQDVSRAFVMPAATIEGHIPAAEVWSPGREQVAYVVVRRHTEVHVLDLTTGQDTNVSGEAAFNHDPVWSPDGRWLAYYSLGGGSIETLMAWSNADHTLRVVGPGQPVSGIQWSPAGDVLAYIMTAQTRSSQLALWNAVTGETVFQAQHSANDAHPVWSPDGAWLAFESSRGGDPGIYIMRPDGTALRPISTGPGRAYRAAWSPDGAVLAYVGLHDGVWRLHIWDAGTGETITPYESTTADLYPLWSPDGRWLAFQAVPPSGDATQVHLWDRVNAQVIAVPGDSARSPVWSPDGERLAYVAQTGDDWDVFVMSVADGLRVNVSQATGRDSDPVWSPDGALLAYRSDRSGVPDLYLWDGRHTQRLTDDPAANANLVWLW